MALACWWQRRVAAVAAAALLLSQHVVRGAATFAGAASVVRAGSGHLRGLGSQQQQVLAARSSLGIERAAAADAGAGTLEMGASDSGAADGGAMKVQGMFGLPPDYSCFARVFDQPRKIRLQCTRQVRRQMNCECTPFAVVSRQLTCDCTAPEANNHAEAEILRQFTDYRSIFPTKIS